MGSFKMNCREAFLSRTFWLSVGLITLVLGLGCMDDFQAGVLLDALDPCALLQNALCSQAFFMALPVIAVLPYGASFLEELKTGFWKEALHRAARRQYVFGKLAVCWLSGAAAVIVGCAIFYGLIEALSGPTTVGVSALLFPLCMEALCGGLCAELGMAAALLCDSKASAYFVPFLSAYVLVILGTRYFPGAVLLNPENWLSFGWPALPIPMILGVLCGVFLWIYGIRRLAA